MKNRLLGAPTLVILAATIDVFHGTILVDLLENPVENGGLACLIRLTTGATDCSE